jgi:hypothetical protein
MRKSKMEDQMRWFCAALVLIPGAAFAEPNDVFPPVIDGIEYRVRYGRQPRPGWSNGLNLDTTREECQRRLLIYPEPAVCMVRKAPSPGLSI